MTFYSKQLIASCALLLLCLKISANHQMLVYAIDASTEVLSFTDTISYFVDTSNELTKDQVEQEEFALSTIIPILNARESFWFRFKIQNREKIEVQFYLCETLHEKRTYFIDHEIYEFGTRMFDAIKTERGCAYFSLPPEHESEIYALHWNLVDSKTATKLEYRTPKNYTEYQLFKLAKYGVMSNVSLGVLGFMSLIAFLIFLVFRLKFLGYYFLYVFSFFAFYSRRTLHEYLLPYDHYIEINLTYLIYSFYLLFLKYFINAKESNRPLNVLINYVVVFSLLCFMLSIFLQIFFDIEISYYVFNVFRICMFLSIISILWFLLNHNKSIVIGLLVFGNLFVLIPVFSTFLSHMFDFTSLQNSGYLFKIIQTEWGFHYYMLHARLGVVIELLFFAVAIAIYLKGKSKETLDIKTQNENLKLISVDFMKKNNEQMYSGIQAELTTFILDHKQDSIRISDLTQAFGMGRTSLIKKIKDETGMTPNKFVKETKLNDAKNELLTTKKSIKEIAFAYGYHDPSYFSQDFKSKFNHSPAQLRTLHEKLIKE